VNASRRRPRQVSGIFTPITTAKIGQEIA
jgi:hypothetical protein